MICLLLGTFCLSVVSFMIYFFTRNILSFSGKFLCLLLETFYLSVVSFMIRLLLVTLCLSVMSFIICSLLVTFYLSLVSFIIFCLYGLASDILFYIKLHFKFFEEVNLRFIAGFSVHSILTAES